jgi:Domain of unknown function (DUF4252)
MKKFVLSLMLAAGVCLQAIAQGDAITRFFNQYAEDEKFTVVYISQKMFDLVSKIETSDPEWNNFREVVKDIKGLRVLAADSITNGLALYREALNKVPLAEYSELLTVRDGQENVRIWVKESGNIVQELLLLVGKPSEFVLLSFTGNLNIEKISTLGKALDVEGVEHLEKLKDKNKKKE